MPPMLNNTTAAPPRPVIRDVEQANTHHVLGGSIAIRLDREQTGGSLGLVEFTVPAGYPGPPMHVHPEFDETFHVTGGEIALRVGNQASVPRAGAVVFVYFDELAEVLRAAGGVPEPTELVELGIAYGSVPA